MHLHEESRRCQDGRVVRALDLSSNPAPPAWVRIPTSPYFFQPRMRQCAFSGLRHRNLNFLYRQKFCLGPIYNPSKFRGDISTIKGVIRFARLRRLWRHDVVTSSNFDKPNTSLHAPWSKLSFLQIWLRYLNKPRSRLVYKIVVGWWWWWGGGHQTFFLIYYYLASSVFLTAALIV